MSLSKISLYTLCLMFFVRHISRPREQAGQTAAAAAVPANALASAG